MNEFTDQMKQTIRLESTPRRIVSLVPSQTELLHYLGLEDELVGITKFCIHPNVWFKTKTRIGGTKSVSFDKVKSLNPDLIIGNKEENAKEDIDALRSIAPVWMSDIYNLSDSIKMLRDLGEILDKVTKVDELISRIEAEFRSLREFALSHSSKGKSVLYFIWNDPGFLAGRNTFIDSMLTECGLINAAKGDRYPDLDVSIQPDLVFLSSEPFPFEEKHFSTYQEKYPNAKIVLVDGEMFSWYGSRLKDAPKYFRELLQSLFE